MNFTPSMIFLVFLLCQFATTKTCCAFDILTLKYPSIFKISPLHQSVRLNSSPTENNNDDDDGQSPPLSDIALSRFPTSPEDQVRQAALSISEASNAGRKRHNIRLLLPIIGATELDDWPGGARQMMEAASPLVRGILSGMEQTPSDKLLDEDSNGDVKKTVAISVSERVIDEADEVRALFSQGVNPVDDGCGVLLPSSDSVDVLQSLDKQVGLKRNLLVVNSQWKRKTDFGLQFFGGNRQKKIDFVEKFEPTYHCSSIMVEGDIVRILRVFPGPWKVYIRVVEPSNNNVDWIKIGKKDVINEKTPEWEAAVAKEKGISDGGKIFDYGIPSYSDVEQMIVSRDGYVKKSLQERAASSLIFIKDTL